MDDLVFTNRDGCLVHPNRFRDQWLSALALSGLPEIRMHDLRHSYATAGLAAGIPPIVMSERPGHSGIAVTLDRYSHVLPSMDSDAANKVASLIFGTAAVTA